MTSSEASRNLSGWRKLVQPFVAYRLLPRIAGAWFLPIALVARLPIAMLPLGTLGLVSSHTGSVGTAGIAAGAISIGAGLGGPVIGQLADRHGQRIVLLISGPLNAAAIALTVVLTRANVPMAVLIAAFFITGCTVPQVSPLARVRWMALTSSNPSTMRAALSYESTVDELTFVLGPAAVGLIASFGGAEMPLITASALTAVSVVAFALHRTSRLPRGSVMVHDSQDPSTTAPSEPARPRFEEIAERPTSFGAVMRAVLVPTLGMASMGIFFGGSQAAVTAFAQEQNNDSMAGLMYAVMGIGSAVTALALVMVPDRITLRQRWIVLAIGQTAAALMLPQASGFGGLAVTLAVVGLFVGPTMVTIFSVATELAPRGREGVAMTLLQSANVMGIALGSAVAGLVADSINASTSYYVPAVAAVLLVLVPVLAGKRLGSVLEAK